MTNDDRDVCHSDLRRRTVLRTAAGVPFAIGGAVPISERTAADGPDDGLPDDEDREYTVLQNGREETITPVGSGDRSVEEFYDYRANSAHTGFEESDTSQLMLYSGTEGLSLVVLHNSRGDGSGGAASFEIAGANDGSWVVQDDTPGGSDDQYTDGESHWVWNDLRTDGGAYRGGLDEEFELTIRPAFNENAALDPLSPGEISDWIVRGGDGTVMPLDMDEPVTIKAGCPGLGELREQKLDLVESVEKNSFGHIEERNRVVSALDDLDERARNCTDQAKSAARRLLYGERVTDAVLAGAGPGSSTNGAGTNVAGDAAAVSLRTTSELVFALLPVKKLAKRAPVLGAWIGRAERAIGDVVADIGGAVSARFERFLRNRSEKIGGDVFDWARTAVRDGVDELTGDEYENQLDDRVNEGIGEGGDLVFSATLFDQTHVRALPVDEAVSDLIFHTAPPPRIGGDDEDARTVASQAIE